MFKNEHLFFPVLLLLKTINLKHWKINTYTHTTHTHTHLSDLRLGYILRNCVDIRPHILTDIKKKTPPSPSGWLSGSLRGSQFSTDRYTSTVVCSIWLSVWWFRLVVSWIYLYVSCVCVFTPYILILGDLLDNKKKMDFTFFHSPAMR